MREIKFRAWDKYNDVMLFNREDISITGNGLVLFDWGSKAPKEQYERTDKFELMQFTGLTDKNGKEVYEGDIVKSEYRGIGRIRWGRYVTENEHNEDVLTYMFISKEELRAYAFDPQTAESYEVIGNIYEDPDLLKEAL